MDVQFKKLQTKIPAEKSIQNFGSRIQIKFIPFLAELDMQWLKSPWGRLQARTLDGVLESSSPLDLF